MSLFVRLCAFCSPEKYKMWFNWSDYLSQKLACFSKIINFWDHISTVWFPNSPEITGRLDGPEKTENVWNQLFLAISIKLCVNPCSKTLGQCVPSFGVPKMAVTCCFLLFERRPAALPAHIVCRVIWSAFTFWNPEAILAPRWPRNYWKEQKLVSSYHDANVYISICSQCIKLI